MKASQVPPGEQVPQKRKGASRKHRTHDELTAKMDPKWLDVGRVAELLGVSTKTVYREAARGRLPGRKVGKQWRFHKERIDAWLKHDTNGEEGSLSELLRTAQVRAARK